MLKKKLFAYVLLLAVILSFSMTVFAADSDHVDGEPFNSGYRSPTKEEYEAYLQNLSEEELLKIEEKYAEANRLSQMPQLLAASKISLPGTFNIYQQETNYYCVPACVKSVLKYLTGQVVSQSSIAQAMGTSSTIGTTPDKVAPYLNARQNFYYVWESRPGQTNMCKYLYATVANGNAPALMGIINPSGSNWHYATGGHFLVVNAIYSDMSALQFADPLGGTQTGWPYYYEKGAAFVSSICEDIVW